MTLTFCSLEATDIVSIIGSGIPSRIYLGGCDTIKSLFLGNKIVPDLAEDRSGLCHMFVDMANLSTKLSSRGYS